MACRVVDPSWIKKEKNEEGVRKERHALISRVERRETTRGDYEREEIGGEEEEEEEEVEEKEKKAGRQGPALTKVPCVSGGGKG